ncbi:MAG: DMT family transporter [Methylococcales bacterium]
MQFQAAYLGVILIWTTTPLAIQWSSQGNSFLFAVTGRMVIGTLIALLLVWIFRLPMAWHQRARRTYLAAAIGIYGAMMAVYWSAQFIPSGWISVIFALTPIITGILAVRWLGETTLTPLKLVGMLLGIIGMATIFYSGEQLSDLAWIGVVGMVISVILHASSSVLVKKAGYGANGLVITTGGLLVSAPLYLLTWFLTGSEWPTSIPQRSAWSILYLGVIGSVLGFALYYFVLKHLGPTRVALITLITPVTALWLGHVFNGESIDVTVITGTAFILSGLGLYEWGERVVQQ